MTDKEHILLLPRWYPNKKDIQLGSFIQKQAILLKDDYHVHVIYVQANENQNQTFDIVSNQENGIDEQIVYFKSAKGPLKKVINARRYKKAQQLAYILDPYRPRIVHVHVPYRSAFLALKLKKSGIPFVITEHWSGHLKGEFDEKNTADKKLYRSVLAKASGIATVSKLLQKKFKENTGFDSIVIPNLILPGESTVSADSEKTELLCVSDLIDETKNISGLLKSFSDALKENDNLQLTIIGGGPDQEKIQDMIDGLGLNEEVNLRGRLAHEEVLEAYANCDFYVCNSNFETFGMAPAEALLAGKPVISSRCGGPEEFLDDTNSILVDVKNTDQLTKAILRMAELYKNYDSARLKLSIQERYGAAVVREQLLDFYNRSINIE